MKTVTIILLCGCMLSANLLFAQKQKSKMLPVVTITAESNVTGKVRDAFFSRFKDAKDMKWFESSQSYLVKFIMNDQLNHASFKKNGSLLYHIAYGVEKNLPESVKNLVKSQYSAYSISRVFNVNRFNRSMWIVNLENEKNYIITSVENDALNEITRYKNVTAPPSAIMSEAY